MIDRLFFIVLVLNATGLFRFLAPQLDVSIAQVSLALLMINVLYLFVKLKYTGELFFRRGMAGWLFVLLLWPLCTLFYAPSFEAREVGLQLYFFLLFFGTIVYTASNGLPAMHRVLNASIVVTVIGLVLSMLAPQYFTAVAELATAKVDKEGRACGFLLQPNSLAITLTLLFIGWFALWEHKSMLLQVAVVLGFLLLMLLTGSRTGMLVALIVVTCILAPSWRQKLPSGKYLLTAGAMIVCLAGGVVGIRHYLLHTINDDVYREDLINRMQNMLSFRLSDEASIKNDGSIQDRLEAQAAYWALIKKKPFLGHGLGSDAYYQETGYLFLSAHSQALTCAMECGLLYPIVCCLLVVQLYRKRSRRDVERILQTNSIGQFVPVIIFLFIINGGLFDSRAFYVILGMFFAAVCCPLYVFSYDETTGRINGVLTRRAIAWRCARGRRPPGLLGPSMHPGNPMAPAGGGNG